jgi:hypothetical protein
LLSKYTIKNKKRGINCNGFTKDLDFNNPQSDFISRQLKNRHKKNQLFDKKHFQGSMRNNNFIYCKLKDYFKFKSDEMLI